MSAKTKLRPMLSEMAVWLVARLPGSPWAFPISNIRMVQATVSHLRYQAVNLYGDMLSTFLVRALDDVEYVLNKMFSMRRSGDTDTSEDLRVFGDALAIRFERLLVELDEFDKKNIE
jgi:hypothetical protein